MTSSGRHNEQDERLRRRHSWLRSSTVRDGTQPGNAGSSSTHFAEHEPMLAPHRKGIYSHGHLVGVGRDVRWFPHWRHWLNSLSFRYPARLTILVFLVLVVVVTAGLMLPVSTASGRPPTLVDAFFTATSAVCVTGLTVVETATYWSMFGQVIILIGIALGGLGVMTMASLLALIVTRRLGLTQRLLGRDDTQGRMGDTGALITGVIVTTLVAETILFLIFFPSFMNAGSSTGYALWSALFTSISTFNNAGFLNLPDGLEAFSSNWFVVLPIVLGTFVGAIGFPVIADLYRRWNRPRTLTLHTKLTLTTFALVAVSSSLLVTFFEWGNPGTFGGLDGSEKTLATLLGMVNSRSLGLSTVDVSAMNSASWFVTDISMFIGGGSGSHAGGIKVTTFAVLLLAAWTEVRGRRDVEAFHRRIPHSTQRQAIAVMLGGMLLVFTVTVVFLIITPYSLDRIVFEVVSAFGTVGLSTGITPSLPNAGKLLLGLVMIVGRVGPITFAAALALKQRQDLIRQPEERPIVG